MPLAAWHLYCHAGLSRTLTLKQFDTGKGEDLVLALLPPYRRSRQRHQVRLCPMLPGLGLPACGRVVPSH